MKFGSQMQQGVLSPSASVGCCFQKCQAFTLYWIQVDIVANQNSESLVSFER